MIFRDELLRPEVAGGDLLAGVLGLAGDRGGARVRPGHLISAAIEVAEPAVGGALRAALVPGASVRDLLDAIDVYAPRSASSTAFDGRRERFSSEALAALDCLDTQLVDDPRRVGVAVELLLACVLAHLDEDDREGLLEVLDETAAIALLHKRAETLLESPPPLLDGATGRLRSEEFSSAAWTVLEHAAAYAGKLGYDRLLPPHCLLGLLAETEGPADQVVRMEGRPGIGPAVVATAIEDSFRLAGSDAPPLELDRDSIADAMIALLAAAQRDARADAEDRIETHHLLAALLAEPPARLRAALEGVALGLDVARMRRRTIGLAQSADRSRGDAPLRLAVGLLPSEDLTFRARNDELQPALHVDHHLEPMQRALCRRTHNHVLITCPSGVGATTIVRELARRAATGEIRALARKRFLWAGCEFVTPEDSKEKLLAVLRHVAGRTDVILCLDGLGPILRGPAGANNKAVLRAALASAQTQVIGVISVSDFRDLLAGDPSVGELFTRVEIDEPARDHAVEIATLSARELEREYGLRIEPDAAGRAVALTADYLLSERLPAKAVRALRRACEDADYEHRQNGGPVRSIGADDIVRAVAELSGIVIETLSGATGAVDYERDLGEAVVGQPEAVRAVAAELRKIKAGASEPGRPAAVMLFAGLPGVGKTELAKALARLYSASRGLHVYTMGNFTDRHSVTGIVGVPPGYHGHDQGGRLINDLNADPNCVFLLDEAEKAHPDVWKPFLTLFEEGWIVDQRGTKAFADRAMFVLTSNVGQELIGHTRKSGVDEIARQVREALADERDSRTGELVFPPEFLSRIGRIVVFRSLDRDAMHAVCRLGIERAAHTWRRQGKALVVAPALAEHIGLEAHRLDSAAHFTEGGRIARRMIDDLVQGPVATAIERDPARFRSCATIELDMQATEGEPPAIDVRFTSDGDDHAA